MKALNTLFVLGMALLPTLAHAQGSGHTGGGADCEIAIADIRNDMYSWIREGGAQSLDLSTSDVKLEDYQKIMKRLLRDDKKVKVKCIDQNQAFNVNGKPQHLEIDGQPKTCINWLDLKTQNYRVVCNSKAFLALSPHLQYQLVHHEFAGLEGVGIERNTGADSDYRISKQVQGSEKLIYRLSGGHPFSLKASTPGGMEPFSRAAIKFIFNAWKNDYSRLSSLVEQLSIAEITNMQALKTRLTIPGEEVSHIRLIRGSSELRGFLGKEIVYQIKVYSADTAKLLFSMDVREDAKYDNLVSSHESKQYRVILDSIQVTSDSPAQSSSRAAARINTAKPSANSLRKHLPGVNGVNVMTGY